MDSFDYSDESLETNRDSAGVIWNILTVIVLLMTLCVCVGVGVLLVNPQNELNPFPPPTLPAEAEYPTATPTPKSVLPPTWTPAPTIIPTQTPAPTNTLIPTNTTPPTEVVASPTLENPTDTPGEGQPTATLEAGTDTATPTVDMPFVLHPGDPVAIPNIAYPELGCNWMGVGGRAFDLSSAAIEEGLFVQLGGTFSNEPVEMLGMIGMVDYYGPGSYEFVLGEELVASTQTLWVQLFDQAMLPLSEQIKFDTFADCDRNLILINFNQVY
jgi:hypothetical protein